MSDHTQFTPVPNAAFRQTMLAFVADPEVVHVLFQFGDLLDTLLDENDTVTKRRQDPRSWVFTAVAGLVVDLDHVRQWLNSLDDCVGESRDREDVRLALAVTDAAQHFDTFHRRVRRAYELAVTARSQEME